MDGKYYYHYYYTDIVLLLMYCDIMVVYQVACNDDWAIVLFDSWINLSGRRKLVMKRLP